MQKRVKNQRLLALMGRHVVTCVGVNGPLGEAEDRKILRQGVDQAGKIVLAPTLPVALAPIASNQRPEDPPRLRRPSYIGLVDVPAPRGGVVPSGGKPKGESEHGGYFS